MAQLINSEGTVSDDFGLTTFDAGHVSVNSFALGTIETSVDQDGFLVSLVAGSVYRFELLGRDSGFGTLRDPALRLFSPAGTLVASNDDLSSSSFDSRVTFVSPSSGNFLLVASSLGGAGTYRITASTLSSINDDLPASINTSGYVPMGGSSFGNIEVPGDKDGFGTFLVAGVSYRFDLEGVATNRGTLSDPTLELRSVTGDVLLASDDDSGTGLNSLIQFTPTSSGTYFLSVAAIGSGTGSYRISASGATAAILDDFRGDANTVGFVPIGGSTTGSIESPSDMDAFRLNLLAGTAYEFNLQGSSTGNGTLVDPQLALTDSSGVNVLVLNDDIAQGQLNSRIVFVPGTSGTYFLQTMSHSPNGTGSYQVSASVASAAGQDDFRGDANTVGFVPIGSSTRGSIESPSDVDAFRLNLVAGAAYEFNLQGSSTGNGTLVDPQLALTDSSGVKVLVLNDDIAQGQLNSRIFFTPGTSGTYFLQAMSHSPDSIGSYQVSASVASSGFASTLTTAFTNIMRTAPSSGQQPFLDALINQVNAGALSLSQAKFEITRFAVSTTSVATLSYEFFTGRIPSAAGIDYLVSPTGPNSNNLNSAYYQSFSLENRYINFAVNLGKAGEGAATFQSIYGSLSLFEATRLAYATIFGDVPSDAKLHAILDPSTVLNGQVFTRAAYFAYYGLDGLNGIGTKAAMVGYLLAEAEKADLGVYARSNDAFLIDLADGANFAVDIVGVYGTPEYVFHPG